MASGPGGTQANQATRGRHLNFKWSGCRYRGLCQKSLGGGGRLLAQKNCGFAVLGRRRTAKLTAVPVRPARRALSSSFHSHYQLTGLGGFVGLVDARLAGGELTTTKFF